MFRSVAHDSVWGDPGGRRHNARPSNADTVTIARITAAKSGSFELTDFAAALAPGAPSVALRIA
jgi:hypothetical protein